MVTESDMTVVTRFAPSPTGYLHIGGARTALFNWLYAKAKGGKFLLRIEDTDRERSTTEAVDALLAGLQWMGIEWDDPPVYQHERANRHREVAEALIATGHAFRCYVTQEELTERREAGMPPARHFVMLRAEGVARIFLFYYYFDFLWLLFDC